MIMLTEQLTLLAGFIFIDLVMMLLSDKCVQWSAIEFNFLYNYSITTQTQVNVVSG